MIYLVDTSVWINYLKGKNPSLISATEKILREGTCCINEIILGEVCYGARDINQYKKYRKYFEKIPMRSVGPIFQDSWDLRYKCKNKGLTIGLPDALIAQTSLHYDLILLSHDKDFQLLLDHCHLQLRNI